MIRDEDEHSFANDTDQSDDVFRGLVQRPSYYEQSEKSRPEDMCVLWNGVIKENASEAESNSTKYCKTFGQNAAP